MKIDISAKLYKKIKDFCEINGVKVGDFCEEKLKEALMVEQYGDTPFTTYTATTETKSQEDDIPHFVNLETNERGGMAPAPWSSLNNKIEEIDINVVSSTETEEVAWPETKPLTPMVKSIPKEQVQLANPEDMRPREEGWPWAELKVVDNVVPDKPVKKKSPKRKLK